VFNVDGSQSRAIGSMNDIGRRVWPLPWSIQTRHSGTLWTSSPPIGNRKAPRGALAGIATGVTSPHPHGRARLTDTRDLPLGAVSYPAADPPAGDPLRPSIAFDDICTRASARCIAIPEPPTASASFSKRQTVRSIVHVVSHIHQPLHVTSRDYNAALASFKTKPVRIADRLSVLAGGPERSTPQDLGRGYTIGWKVRRVVGISLVRCFFSAQLRPG